MTDITELALIKGQKVEAPYYLAECTECGKMYSSYKLIVSRNYFDGDADCYCPHCNADDADIADLGSGEQPAAMAWNYQQARIDALVEALEKAQAVMNAVVTAAAIRGVRPFDGIDCDPPTLEENAEACGDAMSARIRELEANPPKPHHNGLMQISNELASAKQRIAELESRLESADKLQDSAFRSGLQHGFSLGQTDDQKGYEQSMAAYSLASGIKVEAE
ncbi:hypothetical protein PU663_21860 [Klebsiella pneumoniae]|uniref:hypothetical protein n=1 Tax=Klebsiella pneumoniae TaxID=573 RepID=UPI0038D13BAE